MQRVTRLLALLLALALLGAACSGSDSTPVATDIPLETEGDAPEELASVELDKSEDKSQDTDDKKTTAASETDEGTKAEASDEETEELKLNTGAVTESLHGDNAMSLNMDATGAAAVATIVNSETDACVSEALDSEPELRTTWASILANGDIDLTASDQSDAIDPILECASFGEIVAVVIATDSDVTLSDDSIECIDEALEGQEELLVALISNNASTADSDTLVNAMVQCVSVEELNALMQG